LGDGRGGLGGGDNFENACMGMDCLIDGFMYGSQYGMVYSLLGYTRSEEGAKT